MSNLNSPKSHTIIILIIVICAVAIFLYVTNVTGISASIGNVIYSQLNAWKLIPTPEKFTELYFQSSSNLPQVTVAGQPMSFAFTIHNVEGMKTLYPYVVYFEYPDGSQFVITSGTVTLANDALTTISVTDTFLASNLTGKVVVDLPSLDNQSIDFLLPSINQ